MRIIGSPHVPIAYALRGAMRSTGIRPVDLQGPAWIGLAVFVANLDQAIVPEPQSLVAVYSKTIKSRVCAKFRRGISTTPGESSGRPAGFLLDPN
jgi:hypothetical protein